MHVTFGDIALARHSEQVAYRLPPSCKAYRKRAFVCSCFVRRFSLLSLGAMFIKRVERLLYASGVGWQGRVKLEVQNQTHSPCIGTLSFCAPTQRRTKLVWGYVRCFFVFEKNHKCNQSFVSRFVKENHMFNHIINCYN